jgi:uncharacterized membrane protein
MRPRASCAAVGTRHRSSPDDVRDALDRGAAGSGPAMSASMTRLRSSLWFVPVMCVLAGVALSVLTIGIDRWVGFEALPRWLTGGPDAATAILETIAVSMVSLTALVLTVTMVVVQLAMGQFSPRIVQTFLQDRPSQLAIGLFVATFAHAMLTLREVQFEDGGQVPGVAILVAYVLVLTSIAMLVLYVHHIGRSLRVSALIELVGSDTRALIDRRHPHHIVERPATAEIIAAPRSGVLVGIDRDELVGLAFAGQCTLHVAPALGEFVPAGAPLVRIEGRVDLVDRQAVLDALRSGLERTLDEDLAYGFRMLVDMAIRALAESPLSDPTTAVQCIDRLHDGLRQLAVRELDDGELRDDDGTVRLTIVTMDWTAYVALAFDEIRLAGAKSPQVTRRLAAAIEDLRSVVPADRCAALDVQQAELNEALHHAGRDARDTTFALQPDALGIGVAAGRTR